MNIKKLLCIAFCLVLLAGCNSAKVREITLSEPSVATTTPITIPTTQPATEPVTEPMAQSAQPGYYVAESFMEQGIPLDEEYLLELRIYLLLEEDQTGQMSVLGQGLPITWNEDHLILEGMEASYSLGDGSLIIQDGRNCIVFRYAGQELPEEYRTQIPLGFFAVSSVSRDGNVSFYSTVNPENGYIRIRADHTGELFFDGQLRKFVIEDGVMNLNGEQAVYQYLPAGISGEDDGDLLMVMFYGDTVTSIAFRSAEDLENT